MKRTMMKHNDLSGQIVAKPLGRPRAYDLDEALDRAIDVFCERGYSGASINALAEAMGLVTGSLYKAFKDKEALFLASLQRYRAKNRVAAQEILVTEASGMAQLQALLRLYVRISNGEQGIKGCLVVTSAVELTTFSAQVAKLVTESMEDLKRLLEQIVLQGQADGSISRSIEATVAVSFVLCHLQGMRVVGKLNPTAHELTQASALVIAALKP